MCCEVSSIYSVQWSFIKVSCFHFSIIKTQLFMPFFLFSFLVNSGVSTLLWAFLFLSSDRMSLYISLLRFPFYFELKIAFVIWLLSPYTKGSSVLYRKFVHPTLSNKEKVGRGPFLSQLFKSHKCLYFLYFFCPHCLQHQFPPLLPVLCHRR